MRARQPGPQAALGLEREHPLAPVDVRPGGDPVPWPVAPAGAAGARRPRQQSTMTPAADVGVLGDDGRMGRLIGQIIDFSARAPRGAA